MFKYIIILVMTVNTAFAQDKNPGSGQSVSINSGLNLNPLYFVNNNIYYKSITNINPDSIGLIFIEGDSFYVNRIYGTSRDTSLIRKYFGQQRNRGIVFYFTNDRVKVITKKKLKKCLNNKQCRIVFKINDDPLSDNRHELDELNINQITKIQMVQDFKLTKWDTGDEETFILFVIKTG